MDPLKQIRQIDVPRLKKLAILAAVGSNLTTDPDERRECLAIQAECKGSP
jgi:hypothetical protein